MIQTAYAIQSFGLHKWAIQWIGLHTYIECNVLVDVTKIPGSHAIAWHGTGTLHDHVRELRGRLILRRKSWFFAKWDIESRLCYACNLHTATQQLALEQRTALMVSMRIAGKTAKGYEPGAKAFARFAVFYRFLPILPATDRALAAFVSFQSQSCTHVTILGYLSQIRAH